MVPIGRGQRELIIGDRQTGKTAVAIDAIINQKDTGRHLHLQRDRPEAVDDRAGRAHARRSRRDGLHDRRRRAASDPAPLLYISPYSACTIGEFFRDSGRHALVRLRRPVEARAGVPRDLAAAAPAAGPRGVSRATSSTCTRACSSARRS